MFETLKQIVSENWSMRKQIGSLAISDLVKTYRGSALGMVWLFARPAVYVFVFWFTLTLGMRSGKPVNDMPYLLWLVTGIFPWFFMSAMIATGGSVYNRYSYLVNRIRFPLSVISTFYVMSLMIILVAEMAVVVAACLIFQVPITLHVLQVPLILILMFVFWTFYSIAMSPLSALSKDFSNLLRTLTTPLFWLSGIFFHLDSLPMAAQAVMWFNPVAWFVQSMRDSFVYHVWIWEKPVQLAIFLVVFFAIILFALRNYRRLREEVPDVV